MSISSGMTSSEIRNKFTSTELHELYVYDRLMYNKSIEDTSKMTGL